MAICFICTALLLTAAVMYIICYRRQIKKICRQLSYINENETNMIISSELKMSELVELSDKINALLKLHRETINDYLNKDTVLKETITNLSHDIRTPLTSLDGYFQLLEDTEDDAEKQRYKEIISGRIENLKSLLEEIFLYTKLQNSDYVLECSKVQINGIIEKTVLSFYDDFTLRGITPKINLEQKPMTVITNEGALIRILQNVIKNALLYGENQVEIKSEALDKTFRITLANKMSHKNIADSSRVFTRFYKADKSRQEGSTGLGLSIAKELAEKTNARIESKTDNMVFTITIEYLSE